SFRRLFFWLPVKLALANDLLDRRRYEITNGTPRGNSVSDVGGGNVQMPPDHRIGMLGLASRAIEHDELDQFRKLREAMPGIQQRHIVLSDQIEKLGAGFAFAQNLHRVDRIGRRQSLEYNGIE